MTSYGRWKAKEQRDLKHWREWLHSQPCVKCGSNQPQMAHVANRGFGVKCSDVYALPLCEACHLTDRDSQHKTRDFWKNAGLDRDVLLQEHHDRYLSEIDGRPDLVAKFTNSVLVAARLGTPGTLQNSIH